MGASSNVFDFSAALAALDSPSVLPNEDRDVTTQAQLSVQKTKDKDATSVSALGNLDGVRNLLKAGTDSIYISLSSLLAGPPLDPSSSDTKDESSVEAMSPPTAVSSASDSNENGYETAPLPNAHREKQKKELTIGDKDELWKARSEAVKVLSDAHAPEPSNVINGVELTSTSHLTTKEILERIEETERNILREDLGQTSIYSREQETRKKLVPVSVRTRQLRMMELQKKVGPVSPEQSSDKKTSEDSSGEGIRKKLVPVSVKARQLKREGDGKKLVPVSSRTGRAQVEIPVTLIPSSITTGRSKTGWTEQSPIQQPDIPSSVKKKAYLISLLSKRFPDFSLPLNSSSLQSNKLDASGIHVFVDMSNISVGFHTTLKVSKGISKHWRIPGQTLSFHNLSFIFERGRPVAKKLLVGSVKDNAVREAEKIGYKAHILDRVTKAIKKKEKGAGILSDSDSTAPRMPTKQGEQAVDETLQLHIVESIVDYEKPSTIVLASGDAAEGEYCDGFLKTVERCLRHKWKVEIVAWKVGLSTAYRSKHLKERWGTAFRVIELDEYVELLRVEKHH